MQNPRLELEKYLSFEMDTSKRLIYLLNPTKGTKAILKTIDSNLAQKIEKCFEYI